MPGARGRKLTNSAHCVVNSVKASPDTGKMFRLLQFVCISDNAVRQNLIVDGSRSMEIKYIY